MSPWRAHSLVGISDGPVCEWNDAGIKRPYTPARSKKDSVARQGTGGWETLSSCQDSSIIFTGHAIGVGRRDKPGQVLNCVFRQSWRPRISRSFPHPDHLPQTFVCCRKQMLGRMCERVSYLISRSSSPGRVAWPCRWRAHWCFETTVRTEQVGLPYQCDSVLQCCYKLGKCRAASV